MKNMKNQIKTCLLIWLLLLALPAVVNAQFGYSNNGNGTCTITSYTGSGGSVIIPTNINSLTVTSIGQQAFAYSGLTSVTIPSSVTSIGDYAFFYCTYLSAAFFHGNAPPDDGTIFNYDDITTVYYPYGTTGWGSVFGGAPTAIASYPFAYSVNGGTVTITKLLGTDAAVTIPNTIANLPVTSIGDDAFYECNSLKTVTIPDSVTSIGSNAFEYCTSLASVTIPDSVTSIGDLAFESCPSLTNAIIGNGVTSIGVDEFYGSGLTSVTIPNGVSSIGDGAFEACSRLTIINIGNGVTNIGANAFFASEKLMAVNVTTGNSVYSSVAGVLFDKNQTTIIFYPAGLAGAYAIPDGVISIGDEAFFDCIRLQNISIPSSVTSIGDEAFSECFGLTNVTIPNNVTSIGDGAFEHCYYLTGVTIGSSVTSIGNGAFANCGLLTQITIPNSVISIGDSAFDGCDLTNIVIPNSVTSIGDDAFTYTSLTSVNIPDSVISIGNGAFEDCSRLTNVMIGNGVTSMGSYTFTGSSLISVTIGNAVTSIGEGAFYGCFDLTSVSIPNSVTSIGTNAFCQSGLTSVTIPNSVTSIGDGAFAYCNNLRFAYFAGNAPPDDGTAFSGDTATAYYLPDTTGWGSTFGGVPAVLWNPQAKAAGVSAGQFGFNINGPTNAVIVVEACTNLSSPVWIPVSTNTLSTGVSAFSDSQSKNYPTRYYRFRPE